MKVLTEKQILSHLFVLTPHFAGPAAFVVSQSCLSPALGIIMTYVLCTITVFILRLVTKMILGIEPWKHQS